MVLSKKRISEPAGQEKRQDNRHTSFLYRNVGASKWWGLCELMMVCGGGSSVEQPDKLLIKIKYLIIKNKMPYG